MLMLKKYNIIKFDKCLLKADLLINIDRRTAALPAEYCQCCTHCLSNAIAVAIAAAAAAVQQPGRHDCHPPLDPMWSGSDAHLQPQPPQDICVATHSLCRHSDEAGGSALLQVIMQTLVTIAVLVTTSLPWQRQCQVWPYIRRHTNWRLLSLCQSLQISIQYTSAAEAQPLVPP